VEAEERIDLYLQGKLEGKDLDIFRMRLQNDDAFAEEVETRKIIISAIKDARLDELKAYIIDATINDPKVVAFPFRKMLYAAIAASVLVGSAYLLFEQVIDKKVNSVVLKEEDTNDKHTKDDVPETSDHTLSIDKEEHDSMLPFVREEDSTDQLFVTDDRSPKIGVEPILEVDENVMVKQDQMLERKSSSAYFTRSILNDTIAVDKMILTAPVSIESKKKESDKEKFEIKSEPVIQEDIKKSGNKTFEIELWESIVNFKGYKWDGKKLLLYGIDSDENISFHWVADKLFLGRGKDYFLLKQTGQYESYLKVTDQILLDRLLK
jgi:hypothetical protein